MILRFDSVHAFADACVSQRAELSSSEGHSWDLGVSGPRALAMARTGDPSCVASLGADLDAFALGASHELRPRYVSSVAGSRVDVPAYLGGNPMNMRKRAKRESATRHVGIYVSLVCSAGISAETMLRRGAAILGLLETLQAAQIAVDLYLVADMQGASGRPAVSAHVPDRASLVCDGDCTQVIRVESRPLDVATSGFAIAHPAFARNLTYALGRLYGFHGQWSRTFTGASGHSGYGSYARAMARKLDMQPTDIFVPPVSYYDQIVKDPQAWIRARVAQALGGESENTRESESA